MPVTGLLLALLAAAALVVPGFRHEVALSTSRQPQPYVELFFAPTQPADDARCGYGAAGAVRFTVRSHLEESRRLAYRVTLSGPGRAPEVRRGSVATEPGSPRQVRAPVNAPEHHDYTVVVEIPDLDQRLRAHCSGARR